jgi:thiosulfate dehydrogenase
VNIAPYLRAGLLSAVFILFTSAAPAADATRAPPAGATLCEGCHGPHGEGVPAAGVPRLAAQSADYLEKQLRDYASDARQNPVMKNWATQLNDSQRAELAAYYASLFAPYAAQTRDLVAGVSAARAPNAQQLARGHQLAHWGDEARRVQACDNCHGPEGSGVAHSAPYLAGQSAQYLLISLKSWQQGTRKNDAGKLMASVVDRLSDADITAVAAYFADRGSQ